MQNEKTIVIEFNELKVETSNWLHIDCADRFSVSIFRNYYYIEKLNKSCTVLGRYSPYLLSLKGWQRASIFFIVYLY